MKQSKMFFSLYPSSMHSVWHIKKYHETCKEVRKCKAQSREETLTRRFTYASDNALETRTFKLI